MEIESPRKRIGATPSLRASMSTSPRNCSLVSGDSFTSAAGGDDPIGLRIRN